MKYYYMVPDFDKEISGSVYPQCQGYISKIYEKTYDKYATMLYNQVCSFIHGSSSYENNNTPNSRMSFDGFKLHYRAKPTDILSVAMISAPYLVVSENFLNMIKKLKILKYQLHDATIYWRADKTFKYYIFCLLKFTEFIKYVNLEKTEFVTYKDYKIQIDRTESGQYVESFYCKDIKELHDVRHHKPIGVENNNNYNTFCRKMYIKGNSKEWFDIIFLGNIPMMPFDADGEYLYSERFVELYE